LARYKELLSGKYDDWKIREGYFQQMTPLQFPSTLGMDFSGIVKQVGDEDDKSSDFKQGDEVYGQASVFSGGSGAFAELALANNDSIAQLSPHGWT
jgi:alcohol dehydrogenase